MDRKRLFIILGCSIAAITAIVLILFLVKKGETPSAFAKCGDKIFYQGDIYHTMQIGEQCWMKENLKTKNYRDNSPISSLTSNPKWSVDTIGAYACYQNNEENCRDFGALYNWHAVNNPGGLCPEGWSMPTNNQWQELEKNACLNLDCDFSALLGGFRNPSGAFFYLEERGFWWTSTLSGEFIYSWMLNNEKKVRQIESAKSSGYSVRCIKD